MNITNLKGYSGCRILLCEEVGKKPFIRKISRAKDYNERLRIQKNKQQNFTGSDYLRAPEVYGDGYSEEGLYFFDMEYIQGITLSEYMKRIDVTKIRGLAESLINSICLSGKACKNVNEVFFCKISAVEKEIEQFGNDTIMRAISLLKNHDWSDFKINNCHGDLTLENVIVKNDNLYLIDFLDSFYDSPLLDIATILQDALFLWSYRKESVNVNTIIRLMIFKDVVVDLIVQYDKKAEKEIYYALLLKLLRIFPYTTDKDTADFLNEKVRLIMDMLGE